MLSINNTEEFKIEPGISFIAPQWLYILQPENDILIGDMNDIQDALDRDILSFSDLNYGYLCKLTESVVHQDSYGEYLSTTYLADSTEGDFTFRIKITSHDRSTNLLIYKLVEAKNTAECRITNFIDDSIQSWV